MAEYIEREAALQIIDYAKQLTIEQIVRDSGADELLSDTGKACCGGIITALAMCKRLINEAVIAADVQPTEKFEEYRSLLEECERKLSYLFECEIESTWESQKVKELIAKIQSCIQNNKD